MTADIPAVYLYLDLILRSPVTLINGANRPGPRSGSLQRSPHADPLADPTPALGPTGLVSAPPSQQILKTPLSLMIG